MADGVSERGHVETPIGKGLALLLALFCPSVLLAQPRSDNQDIDTPGLAIDAIAGWDGTVDPSAPVPVSFRFQNDSDRVIEGELELFDPMSGFERNLGEVFIGPGSTRRFSSIQDLSDWFECIATLTEGGEVLWRRELSLRTGQDFSGGANVVLFIDGSGRKLPLPGPAIGAAAIAATETGVAGEAGRIIQCLSVRPWQVPNHPGPLIVAQAIVFPERADEDELNHVQWRSVAEWMCQGGTVFVHDKSREIVDQLTAAAPLGTEPADPSGEFVVRRVGLGAIYEYSQPLFASESRKVLQSMAAMTALLPRNHVSTLVDSDRLNDHRGGRADLNRMLLMAFFGIYALLSGLVAMLLFRLSQRRIAAYTVSVVASACVLSGLLGVFLRSSRGDLRWITVTQAGAGGAVQVGRLEAQSAGGRNTKVSVTGPGVDLQYIGRVRRYYRWNRRQTEYSPFTWQPNLASGETDTYQVTVPTTPWGRRQLLATAYSRELERIDFKLQFSPRDSPVVREREQAGLPGMPAGTFSLMLANHLPFDILDCWIVIGVTHWSPSENALIDVYHKQRLRNLSSGEISQDRFEASFDVMESDWELARSWSGGSMFPPRISRLGTATAWIIARVESSPVIAIDEGRSDFVPHEQLHLFVQEILPEDMPDASLFRGAGE